MELGKSLDFKLWKTIDVEIYLKIFTKIDESVSIDIFLMSRKNVYYPVFNPVTDMIYNDIFSIIHYDTLKLTLRYIEIRMMKIGTSIESRVSESVHGLMWNSLRRSVKGLISDSVKIPAIDAVWTPVSETITPILTW